MQKYLPGILVLLIIVLTGTYHLYSSQQLFFQKSKEVHVHADFIVHINNQKLDLSSTTYQSTTEKALHPHVHLHDGDDHVVHRHADGITFVEFLGSLGYTVSNDCFTNKVNETFCTDTENILTLYVNKKPVDKIVSYIAQEEDQVLLYYGTRDNPNITEYLNSVTDESCIYSGTCPERGIAPPESCGLTCEI